MMLKRMVANLVEGFREYVRESEGATFQHSLLWDTTVHL